MEYRDSSEDEGGGNGLAVVPKLLTNHPTLEEERLESERQGCDASKDRTTEKEEEEITVGPPDPSPL